MFAINNLVGFGASSGGFIVQYPINGIDYTSSDEASYVQTGTTQAATSQSVFTFSAWMQPTVNAANTDVSVRFFDNSIPASSSFKLQASLFDDGINPVEMSVVVSGATLQENEFQITTTEVLLSSGGTVSTPVFLHATIDLTQATEADRFKVYYALLGGPLTEITPSFYPPQNDTFFSASVDSADDYAINFDNGSGIIGNVVFIDGTAYANTTFCTTAGGVGPKTDFSVSYGNKGFYYAVASDGTKYNDSSGNGRTITPDAIEPTFVADWISA